MPQSLKNAVPKWYTVLVFMSLVAIGFHVLLEHRLIFPALLSSARDMPFFHGRMFSRDIPLVLVIVVGGIPLLCQMVWKLAHGQFGADLLAAIALVAAVSLQEYLAAVLIIVMLAGGQALEAYAMRKASAVLQALAERMPSTAHRQRGAHIEDIALSEIHIGEALIIYPHETCPVDGTVIEGHGAMDESYLTGEPYLVSKAPGVGVLSGAINGETLLTIRAEKLATDSRYAKIMGVMAEAEQKRPTLRRLGDQLGTLFAPVALALALAAWYCTSDAIRFLAVLVIATPCPLLIAIPITVISAISLAAKRGIIIKDPTVLERLPVCTTAIFDKTGTLTYGQPELTEVLPAEGRKAQAILQQTASLERYSKHPLATAILKAAAKANLPLLDADSVSEKPGHGLTGTVDGHAIQVTSRKKLLQSVPDMGSLLPPISTGLECVIVVDGRYAATLRLRDAPRAEGQSFISHLAPTHKFQRVMLVSGDRESEVRYLAGLLGIQDILASQSPEQKLAVVREEAAKAPTLFMGDGINDAPALAAATVGIAFGGHTVTAESAGAVIMDNTLIKVDELMHLSMAMRRIALQSAVGGILLSIIGMGFAVAGYIPPVSGAILQEVIDGLAILNALQMTWTRNIAIDMA